MQQQSMQYHIDAIRNILSLNPRATKRTHSYLMHLDCYESIKKNIKHIGLQEQGIPQKIHNIGLIIIHTLIINVFVLIANAFTPILAENNPIKILYLPICLYILWVNYSCIYANSLGQKLALGIYLMCVEALLLITTVMEIFNNLHTTTSLLPRIYIPIMIITTCTSILTTILWHIEEKISTNKNNVTFIANNMFIPDENKSTPSEETLAAEYIRYMIHESRDIIVIGHKSPIHATLVKRNKILRHNRTILEQHLYHLSCQIPLIYLTPSGNYIPNNINIIDVHNTTTPIFTDPKKEAEEKNIQFPALRVLLQRPSKYFHQAQITNAIAILKEFHPNTIAFIHQLEHAAYDIEPRIYHNLDEDELNTAEECGIIRTVNTKGNPYRLTPLGTHILQTQYPHKH